MSTITPTYPNTIEQPRIKQVKWVLGDADTGVEVDLSGFPDKTVTLTGTFGGATVVVSGSNDGVTFITFADPQGNAISKTSDAMEALLENPRYIRVSSSGGSGTSVIAIITARMS